jgi:hypothetical protein
MRRIVLIVSSLLAVVALPSCDRKAEADNVPAAAAPATRTGTPASPAAATPPAADPTGAGAVSAPVSRVARIVFLAKENCCACTQRAQDASWAAIQEALGGAAIPVERIHFDTQAEQAAPYRELRPMMAPPGIYFLDAAGGLVDMLQGEVTAEAVRAVLFP